MVYGLWFQIYYPPWNEQRGKNPENWPFQKETHGIPTIYFQGQFVSFREGKTAEWGHVSTVCLSNRRTRTILEIESVPPNKKYRVGLNLSKVLYQVSKWNETSKHIKASTLTNSVVVSFPPETNLNFSTWKSNKNPGNSWEVTLMVTGFAAGMWTQQPQETDWKLPIFNNYNDVYPHFLIGFTRF